MSQKIVATSTKKKQKSNTTWYDTKEQAENNIFEIDNTTPFVTFTLKASTDATSFKLNSFITKNGLNRTLNQTIVNDTFQYAIDLSHGDHDYTFQVIAENDKIQNCKLEKWITIHYHACETVAKMGFSKKPDNENGHIFVTSYQSEAEATNNFIIIPWDDAKPIQTYVIYDLSVNYTQVFWNFSNQVIRPNYFPNYQRDWVNLQQPNDVIHGTPFTFTIKLKDDGAGNIWPDGEYGFHVQQTATDGFPQQCGNTSYLNIRFLKKLSCQNHVAYTLTIANTSYNSYDNQDDARANPVILTKGVDTLTFHDTSTLCKNMVWQLNDGGLTNTPWSSYGTTGISPKTFTSSYDYTSLPAETYATAILLTGKDQQDGCEQNAYMLLKYTKELVTCATQAGIGYFNVDGTNETYKYPTSTIANGNAIGLGRKNTPIHILATTDNKFPIINTNTTAYATTYYTLFDGVEVPNSRGLIASTRANGLPSSGVFDYLTEPEKGGEHRIEFVTIARQVKIVNNDINNPVVICQSEAHLVIIFHSDGCYPNPGFFDVFARYYDPGSPRAKLTWSQSLTPDGGLIGQNNEDTAHCIMTIQDDSTCMSKTHYFCNSSETISNYRIFYAGNDPNDPNKSADETHDLQGGYTWDQELPLGCAIRLYPVGLTSGVMWNVKWTNAGTDLNNNPVTIIYGQDNRLWQDATIRLATRRIDQLSQTSALANPGIITSATTTAHVSLKTPTPKIVGPPLTGFTWQILTQDLTKYSNIVETVDSLDYDVDLTSGPQTLEVKYFDTLSDTTLQTRYAAVTASEIPPVAIISNIADNTIYTGPSNSLTKTYTVGDTALWSYANASSGTYDNKSWTLVPSQQQTDVVNTLSGSWDTTTSGTTTHTLTLILLNGFDVVSSATLVIILIIQEPIVAAITTWSTNRYTSDFTDTSQELRPGSTPWQFTVTNTSTGPYDHAVWTTPLETTVVTNTQNTFTGVWAPTHSETFVIQLTLYDINNNVVGIRTLNYPRTKAAAGTAAITANFSNTRYITNFTDVTSGTSSAPWTFSVTNSSEQPYDHFKWTKIPDQLTNISYVNNDLYATWTPTYNQNFTFELTIYRADNTIIDTRTITYPRTVASNATPPNIPTKIYNPPTLPLFIQTRTPDVAENVGTHGGHDSTNNNVLLAHYSGSVYPEIQVPNYYNLASDTTAIYDPILSWPVPNKNYFMYVGINSTTPFQLYGQQIRSPTWRIPLRNSENPALYSHIIQGLNNVRVQFNREFTPDGQTRITNTTTGLPVDWTISNILATQAFSYDYYGDLTPKYPQSGSPTDVYINHTDAVGTNYTVVFAVNIVSAADSNLYIQWKGPLKFVKPDSTESPTYMGYSVGGTVYTEMLIDPSYYSVVGGTASIKIKHGQITGLFSFDCSIGKFRFVNKLT